MPLNDENKLQSKEIYQPSSKINDAHRVPHLMVIVDVNTPQQSFRQFINTDVDIREHVILFLAHSQKFLAKKIRIFFDKSGKSFTNLIETFIQPKLTFIMFSKVW